MADLTRRRAGSMSPPDRTEAGPEGPASTNADHDDSRTQDTAPPEAVAALRESTWVPRDLTYALAGNGPPPPAILENINNACFVYAGKIHSFAGEAEAGKSWGALLMCAQQLRLGAVVVYADWEDGPETAIGRLKALGVEDDLIRGNFIYMNPEEAFNDRAMLFMGVFMEYRRPSVIVIDAMTEAMSGHGLNHDSNPDIAEFMALVPRWFARRGAAVVIIDHVTKNRETRGRYAIGGQHKLAAIDGAAYTFEVVEPFGRGRKGRSRILIQKDRPGFVRGYAKGGRVVGSLVLHSNTDGSFLTATIEPPEGLDDDRFRPTVLMERVSRYIENQKPRMPNTRDILGGTEGGRSDLQLALSVLIDEGYVHVESRGAAKEHALIKPFRHGDES